MLKLSGAGFLGLGLATRPLSADASQRTGFKFVHICDIHCRDERCHPWLRKIADSMSDHDPAFVMINGDLSENGLPVQISAVLDIFGSLGVPVHCTVGNHDYNPETGRAAYEKLVPNSINYHFEHRGWQFVALDSTENRLVVFTDVQPPTLAYLDATMPALDRDKPTVLFTHFPMGNGVLCQPFNAAQLMNHFDGYNLRASFSGHWHGYAERHFEHATVTNSRCGSWWRTNMDNSPEKGYFLCETTPDGNITHKFIVVS